MAVCGQRAVEPPMIVDRLVPVLADGQAFLRNAPLAPAAIATRGPDSPGNAVANAEHLSVVSVRRTAARNDGPDGFVAEHARHGRWPVAGDGVQIATADGGQLDRDDHLTGTQTGKRLAPQRESLLDAAPNRRGSGVRNGCAAGAEGSVNDRCH